MFRPDHPTASGTASVSIGGDALGSVSTVYAENLLLDRSLMPMAAAAMDPGGVFAAVGLSAFTGREWLATEVDRFVATHACGYVFIEAEAGLGKTAFAAWLVKTRGYLSHFSRHAGGGSVTVALGNLSAQLIRKFGLDELAPAGMLPEWSRTPGGFESVLTAAARAAGAQRPVVLVADGMDEAQAPDGMLPFGLPLLLPEGVFVIGTYRTGRAPRRPDAPARVVPIDRQDPRNRRDIDEFLAAAAREAELAARLAEARVDPVAFTTVLAERCGGVWVYLRYVLDEMRIGLRHPSEVSGLPAGLHSYYADQLRRWQQDAVWRTALLPLLATLGAAEEPLSAISLARLAGGLAPADVQRWCDLTVRPLLTAVRPLKPGNPLKYEIYHATFRELLAGSAANGPGSPDSQGYELVALAGELSQATVAAHGRISDAYLEFFGGLGPGLPVLAGDLDAADIDGGYPLRHLARHLYAADRTGELHALLAVEHQGSRNLTINTWFAAHDHADTVISYLADLALAREDSAAVADRDLRSGRPAPSLGMEIRYRIMAATISSTADKVPAELLGHLIRIGIWSSRRGLDHAQRIADPARRSDALLAVCSQLDAQDRPAVLAHALDAATAVTSDFSRACALADLAPHLPASLMAYALDAAAAITDHTSRAWALREFVPHLPEADRLTVVVQALDAATAISDHQSRVWALVGLAPHLPEADRLTVVVQALDAANAVMEFCFQAWALADLAPYLPEADRSVALAQALTAATADGEEDSFRARSLAKLAPQLPETDRSSVLAQALGALPDAPEFLRPSVLAILAPHLPADLLAHALAAATAISDESHRAEALADLAPHLPVNLLAQALEAATAIADNNSRAWALRELAPHLPVDLLVRALDIATAITGHDARARALTALTPHLPENYQPGALARALAAASISFDRTQGDCLAGLAPHLPVNLLTQALEAATAIADNCSRACALTGLAPYLPEADQQAVFAQALTAATATADDYSRALALARLAPYLPEADQAVTSAQALEAVTVVPDPFSRVLALAGITPYLPKADRPAILAQALGTAAAITMDEFRADALVALARQLPADLLAQALDATATLDDHDRIRALTAFAPYLPFGLLAPALSLASYNEQVLRVLLERAGTLYARDSRLPYVVLLREWLTHVNRKVYLRSLVTAAPAVSAAGGTTAVRHCADAVIDVYRWWL